MPGFPRYGALALAFLAPLALSAARAAEGVKLRALPAIYVDDKGTGLQRPEAVAFDGKSLLVVADTGNGRLLRYTVAAGTVTPAGEMRLPGLPYPVQVQVNSRGEIFALDGKLHRIARLSQSGAFQGYIFPPAETGVDPFVPRSFRIDGQDSLYVLDIFRARIHVLDPEGRPQREIGFPPTVSCFSDLAVDGRGNVFALQSAEKRVYVARKGEAVLLPLTEPMAEDLAYPTALAVDGAGRIYIADQNGGGIVILGPDGSFRGRQSGMGWKEGLLRYPSGLCFGGAGILFVADRENNRIQVFALSE